MRPTSPSLDIRRLPDRTVLRFTDCDALDEYSSPAACAALSLLGDVKPGESLLLDLAGLRYLTSTGLGALVALDRRVRAAGGRLALANAGPLVRQALLVTRLDQLLGLLPDGDPPAAHLSA